MKRDLICIVCPRGCAMQVELEDNKVIAVTGNACKRGEQYAIDECTNPTRMVTSLVRVTNRKNTMVSVKTAAPIPKGNIFDLMELINAASVEAPVSIGDVVLADVYGTDVIITKDIL